MAFQSNLHTCQKPIHVIIPKVCDLQKSVKIFDKQRGHSRNASDYFFHVSICQTFLTTQSIVFGWDYERMNVGSAHARCCGTWVIEMGVLYNPRSIWTCAKASHYMFSVSILSKLPMHSFFKEYLSYLESIMTNIGCRNIYFLYSSRCPIAELCSYEANTDPCLCFENLKFYFHEFRLKCDYVCFTSDSPLQI